MTKKYLLRMIWLPLLLIIPYTAPSPPTPQPPEIKMPSLTHQLLAIHAAESHGLPAERSGWIGQGAYNEDHCVNDPYPPCQGLIAPFGFHSWDPDTGGFWVPPIIPSGSGLVYFNTLFTNAVQAYANGEVHSAYLWLGRAVHILGDLSTPAHANLDMHLLGDSYEEWLEMSSLANTNAWLSAHPAGVEWDMEFEQIPTWDALTADLKNQLENASLVYGGRSSGQELWALGPAGSDAVLFRLLFLMAEEADNYDSDDVSGEQHQGNLDDPLYLTGMRGALFPLLVRYGSALIDYFEYTAVETRIYLPLVVVAP